MMIEGKCIANDINEEWPTRFGKCIANDINEEWPTRFVAVPRKGEFIKSKRGMVLKVERVTHIGGGHIKYSDGAVNANPQIEVELVKW